MFKKPFEELSALLKGSDGGVCDADSSVTKWTLYDIQGYDDIGWPKGDVLGVDITLQDMYEIGVYEEEGARKGERSKWALANPTIQGSSPYSSTDAALVDAEAVRVK